MRRLFTAALLGTLTAGMVLAKDVFVAPKGSGGDGSRERPFTSLEAARDAARQAGPGPHRLVLLPGAYLLDKTLQLTAADNGLTVEAAESGSVTLYGGRAVTGWRPDGERFWCADLPGVKQGTWDFRALVVNGRLPERARMPETGTFTHESVFDARWLSSVGGGWERKPTEAELTTLVYTPTNLPATLDVRNAEVRVYHMWDDSLVGVASNDVARHTLHFTTPSGHPAGAFGVKKYVVFNTREGLTRPGQWYLDRSAGRLVYWPLPGEEMAQASVYAPSLERVISIDGSAKTPAERITLRGFSVQATTTPLKPGGFSAGQYDGAVSLAHAQSCAVENVEICNVGGQAVKSWNLKACRISGCRIHDVGACGIRTGGDDCVIASNRIHHVGLYQPSAVALQFGHSYSEANPKGYHIFRNEIHDAPYSGMTASGGGHRIEENLIYRVMRELHDGAAIYGMLKHSVLCGNVVRDVVEVGKGYGASAYYLDEGSADCVIERNVAVGVPMPTHNHITSRLVIRDNVFISDTDLKISFPRSCDASFTGNTLFAPGKVTVTPPNAVTSWVGNVLFEGGAKDGAAPGAFAIGDAMPPSPPPARRSWPYEVARVAPAPVVDGEIGDGEWPGSMQSVDRLPSRWGASGAPAFAKFAYDDQCLYVALNAVLFDIGKLRKGETWGQDDGAEVCIAGAAGTFVLRGFAGGASACVTDAGVSAEAAAALAKAVRFSAKPYGKTKNDWKSGWRAEWAIPFAALGVKPEAGKRLGFNLGLYRAEDGLWRCLEGTQAENWRLDQAAQLQLK
jgi:hypothetical protein